MSVFKQIGGGNHIVEPFEVNANHNFAWLSGSATDTNGQSSPTSSLSGSGFSINLANEPPTNYPVGTTQALGGITDGGFYSYPLFNSVKKYFYVGEVSASSNNAYEFYPSGSMFVWNVGSNYTGEGIKPDTFKIELDGSSTNIQDDGTGKLKLNKTGAVVGNISYSHGIAAVQRHITAASTALSADGISILDDTEVTSTFQSIVNIYEHTVTCKIQPTEYNVTFNPSTYTTVNTLFILTGASYTDDPTITHDANTNILVGMSVAGTGIPVGATVDSVTSNTVFELSVSTTGGAQSDEDLTLEGLGVGNYSNRIDSGSALPYVTTLGLYNDFNELLAVAKLSKPLTRMKYSDQTFVIKFDE